MSMLTNSTKESTKKKGRWQAALIAGLVLVGSVAVPQAAGAASTTESCSSYFTPGDCAVWVNAKNDVEFRISSTAPRGAHRYTVRTPGGRLLCSGTITPNQNFSRNCWFGTYTGKVKITIQKKHGAPIKIHATY